MTPEGTVIDPVCTLVPFACGLRPDLFGSGAVLVPDIADPGAVADVGVEFMMCTDGVRSQVGCIPYTLPQRPPNRPVVYRLATASISDAYARHTPTLTFVQGFLCLLDRQHCVHFFNRGRLVPLYREAYHHSRDRRQEAV